MAVNTAKFSIGDIVKKISKGPKSAANLIIGLLITKC